MTKLAIEIKGMHCDACVRSVLETLSSQAGIRELNVSVGKVELHFDKNLISKADLLAAISAAGTFEIVGFSQTP